MNEHSVSGGTQAIRYRWRVYTASWTSAVGDLSCSFTVRAQPERKPPVITVSQCVMRMSEGYGMRTSGNAENDCGCCCLATVYTLCVIVGDCKQQHSCGHIIWLCCCCLMLLLIQVHACCVMCICAYGLFVIKSVCVCVVYSIARGSQFPHRCNHNDSTIVCTVKHTHNTHVISCLLNCTGFYFHFVISCSFASGGHIFNYCDSRICTTHTVNCRVAWYHIHILMYWGIELSKIAMCDEEMRLFLFGDVVTWLMEIVDCLISRRT